MVGEGFGGGEVKKGGWVEEGVPREDDWREDNHVSPVKN